MKQTWSDSLDFDAFTSQKKLAKSKVQLIFKCWLWWIQAVQKHSHDSHRPEILTSSQPFHPEATYCGKDPEDICHPGYPSECDIVRHHVTHPQMAQVFPRKIFLKKHPSENILWSIRNHWLVRLVMNELVKRLHANYWAKNTKKKTTSSSLKSRLNWIFQWHLLQPVKEHWLLKLETIQICTSSVMTYNVDVQKRPEKKSPKSCSTQIASKCSKKLQKKHYAYSDQELERTRSPVLHPARRHQSVLPPRGFPIQRWHGPFKPTPNVPFCIQQLNNIGQIRYICM